MAQAMKFLSDTSVRLHSRIINKDDLNELVSAVMDHELDSNFPDDGVLEEVEISTVPPRNRRE